MNIQPKVKITASRFSDGAYKKDVSEIQLYPEELIQYGSGTLEGLLEDAVWTARPGKPSMVTVSFLVSAEVRHD